MLRRPDPYVLWVIVCLTTVGMNMAFGWSVRDAIRNTSEDLEKSKMMLVQADQINRDTIESMKTISLLTTQRLNDSLQEFQSTINQVREELLAAGDAPSYRLQTLHRLQYMEQVIQPVVNFISTVPNLTISSD